MREAEAAGDETSVSISKKQKRGLKERSVSIERPGLGLEERSVSIERPGRKLEERR